MFDLEAFAVDFAAWDAASRSSLCVGAASSAAIGVAEGAEDAIAEIRRLRAEVDMLRAEVDALRVEREQAATVRHVWGVCEDVEAP
jgi:outer membrane murein-binding lipoprotein Lpp